MNGVALGKVAIAVVAAGAVIWTAMTQLHQPKPEVVECIPEGGLTCNNDTLGICRAGRIKPAGACLGGCREEGGIARCLSKNGTLVAPQEAICRQGMGVCGMEPNSLLVCQQGRLAHAAECPEGCHDQGDGKSLYCMGLNGTLRFAAGFTCPKFELDTAYTCGPDGKSLLVCTDGYLAPHTVRCHQCLQTRRGDLTCIDEQEILHDPATGDELPPRLIRNQSK